MSARGYRVPHAGNRLVGHGLPSEGKVRDADGRLHNGAGKARCECGETSNVLPSTSQRQAWHRAHKDAKRAAAARP